MSSDFFHGVGYFLWPLLMTGALVTVGLVFGSRAGAGRQRLWFGLGLLIVDQLFLGFAPAIIYPLISGDGFSGGFAVYGLVQSVISSVLLIAGVALIASAAVIGRNPRGALDVSRPGAPPSEHAGSGYQGPGYPPAGGTTSSPYVDPQRDRPAGS